MKRMLSLCATALCLTLALTPTALAADFEPAVPDAKVCYPTAIVRNDDGTELKQIYDLSPEDDPAGIPRSNFQQDGFQYNLTDLLCYASLHDLRHRDRSAAGRAARGG